MIIKTSRDIATPETSSFFLKETLLIFKTLFLSYFLILLAQNTYANVVGSDAQNFNTTTNGISFITVQSSETLEPGILNLGFFYNYSKNTLPYFNNGNKNDSMSALDFNAGFGILNNWDMGISFPYLASQSVNSSSSYGQFTDRGNTEIRINSKYRLIKNPTWGLAIIGSINNNRIKNNPFTGTSPKPTFNAEIVADTHFQKIALALNFGYRFRNPGNPLPGIPEIEPYKDQWIGSLAASYYFSNYSLKAITEIFGSYPAQKTKNSARELTTLEWIAGIKYDLTNNLAAHIGGGTQILQGSATPDWRIYTGINWTIGPLFRTKAQEKVEKATIYKIERNNENEVVEITPMELETSSSEDIEEGESLMVKDIFFETNSDIIDSGSAEALDILAQYLNKPPALKQLVIEGHTDSTGPYNYNIELSKRRAVSVAKYLVKNNGIPTKKIRAIGYGPTRPIADNGNYQGREKNRRVEFRIIREDESTENLEFGN